MTGIVQRKSGSTMFVTVGGAEGILLANEQVPGERFNVHDRLKVYIMDVKKTTKGTAGVSVKNSSGPCENVIRAGSS